MSIFDEIYTSFIAQPSATAQAREEADWQAFDLQAQQSPAATLSSMMETDPNVIAQTSAAVAQAKSQEAANNTTTWVLIGGGALALLALSALFSD